VDNKKNGRKTIPVAGGNVGVGAAQSKGRQSEDISKQSSWKRRQLFTMRGTLECAVMSDGAQQGNGEEKRDRRKKFSRTKSNCGWQ